jgi:hypothetical protein
MEAIRSSKSSLTQDLHGTTSQKMTLFKCYFSRRFAKRRPLTTILITYIYFHYVSNETGPALLVVVARKVSQYKDGLGTGRLGSIPGRRKRFFYSVATRPTLGLNQPSVLKVPGAPSPGIKTLG